MLSERIIKLSPINFVENDDIEQLFIESPIIVANDHVDAETISGSTLKKYTYKNNRSLSNLRPLRQVQNIKGLFIINCSNLHYIRITDLKCKLLVIKNCLNLETLIIENVDIKRIHLNNVKPNTIIINSNVRYNYRLFQKFNVKKTSVKPYVSERFDTSVKIISERMLKLVNVHHNVYKQIINQFGKFQFLQLINMNIHSIDTNGILYLTIDQNPIRYIELNDLLTLSIAKTRIKTIENSDKLRWLNAYNSKLEHIKNVPNLNNLSIGKTKVKSLPNFDHLVTLSSSGNISTDKFPMLVTHNIV